MIYTVDEYREMLTISETRNKLVNAFYLLQDIGYNIIDMPTMTLDEMTSQKQLMLNLLDDVRSLIVNNEDVIQKELQAEDATNFMIFKNADNKIHWIGTPSNKFEDKHKHIVMEKAHKHFVEVLEKGEAEYPKLLLWHEDSWEVGNTQWVAYDDDGFLVAGGEIYPQYEQLMKELQAEPLGMSHRMPVKFVEFEPIYDPNKGEYLGIGKYISTEFSVLPLNEAASELTNWGV